jgi:hypothetical protein
VTPHLESWVATLTKNYLATAASRFNRAQRLNMMRVSQIQNMGKLCTSTINQIDVSSKSSSNVFRLLTGELVNIDLGPNHEEYNLYRFGARDKAVFARLP